jgi:AraC-like DNA-binding protein
MIPARQGLSEESEFTMALPGGGALHAHRRVRPLPEGLTWIEEEMEIDGVLSGVFATGPGWIFELHAVIGGAVSYLRDGVSSPISSARFGLLYAPYSITELRFENLKTRWVGMAGQSTAGGESLVIDIDVHARPATPSELLTIIGAPREGRSIERCPRPSAVVGAAKAALDAAYRSTPSIASVAAGLGVSHPHLTREFKRELGMTPMAYRHALRASEAAGRLSQGESIVDAAGRVGYEDLGRFYKSFRQALNVPPGQGGARPIRSRSARTVR